MVHSNSNHDVNTEDERNNDNKPLFLFSSIVETPIDSNVIEKPYTVILMEDEVSLFPHNSYHGNNNNNNNNNNNGNTAVKTCTASWIETFRSKIPREHGMSFGSISLNSSGDAAASISDGLEALKASQLPSISDAILVARGPVASLCAQYYLESFSLQGLVMIDPILVDDDKDDDDKEAISSLLSRIYNDDDDDDDKEARFRSTRLLVEPNAVPMMVVLTVPNDEVWNRASRFVAARHGDPDGPYGIVPIVNLAESKNANAEDETEDNVAATTTTIALDRINEWIDETL